MSNRLSRELLMLAREVLSSSAEKEVERLFRALLPGTPWAGKAFAVGGYVRDQVMGLEAKDLDVVVGLKGGAEKLTHWLHKKFPTATTNPHQLGVGYPIWQVTFKSNIDFEGETYHTDGAVIEFADSQKEAFPDPTSRQRITEPGSIEEDVERRDFTVNMLLRDLSTGELRDLTGTSEQDIRNGILRGHPGVDFNKILADDPLRMLRLIRFQAKYGWRVPIDVVRAVKRNSQRIQIISAERIRDELVKIAKLGKLAQAIRFMKAVGLLRYVLPEIEAMRGVRQSPQYHAEGDVFRHTLLVLRNAPPTIEGQFAALLHDVGKPKTQQILADSIHFYEHEDVGAEMAQAIMARLKFDNETTAKVVQVVRNHMRAHSLPDASEKALRKFVRDLGEEMTEAILDIAEADETASLGELSTKGEIQRLRARLKAIREAPVPVVKKSILNGNEIMTLLGIKPGPKVKEVMEFLVDLQDERAIEGKVLTKEEAIEAVKQRLPA